MSQRVTTALPTVVWTNTAPVGLPLNWGATPTLNTTVPSLP
jgi:hypothetical protein